MGSALAAFVGVRRGSGAMSFLFHSRPSGIPVVKDSGMTSGIESSGVGMYVVTGVAAKLVGSETPVGSSRWGWIPEGTVACTRVFGSSMGGSSRASWAV